MTTTNDAVCPRCGSKLRTAIRGDTEEISLVCGAFCGWASRDIPVRELLLTADNQLVQAEAVIANKQEYIELLESKSCDLGKDVNDANARIAELEGELANYYAAESEVAKVYCSLTDGKLSKINTLANAVIGEVEDVQNQVIEEITSELTTERDVLARALEIAFEYHQPLSNTSIEHIMDLATNELKCKTCKHNFEDVEVFDCDGCMHESGGYGDADYWEAIAEAELAESEETDE